MVKAQGLLRELFQTIPPLKEIRTALRDLRKHRDKEVLVFCFVLDKLSQYKKKLCDRERQILTFEVFYALLSEEQVAALGADYKKINQTYNALWSKVEWLENLELQLQKIKMRSAGTRKSDFY